MNLELLTRYRHIIKNNRNEAKNASRYRTWGMLDNYFPNYDITFQILLEEFGFKSIKDIVGFQKTQKQEVNGLDLYGTGSALEDLSLNKGLGIALGYHNTWEKERRQKQGIDFIAGDLFLRSTWSKINEWIKPNGMFQLILCRPIGGFSLSNSFASNPEVYYTVFKNIWRVLDNNGFFISEVPLGCEEFLPGLSNMLNPFAEVRFRNRERMGKIMVRKNKNAPSELPKRFQSINL